MIGVVLGHYFGQRGVERAESARARAEKLKEEVADDFSEGGGAHVETVQKLNQQLDLRDAAIKQAVGLLEENAVGVDSESPIAKLLFSEDGDEDIADEEEE